MQARKLIKLLLETPDADVVIRVRDAEGDTIEVAIAEVRWDSSHKYAYLGYDQEPEED